MAGRSASLLLPLLLAACGPSGAPPKEGPLPSARVEAAETPEPAAQPAKRPDDLTDRGLLWLAAHQSADGGWEAAGFGSACRGAVLEPPNSDGSGLEEFDVGVTGLAAMAFLSSGYTNRVSLFGLLAR